MFSTTRRWLRRNRNGIAMAAGVVGATYMAGQYVIGKITEARERSRSEQLARENLRRRFEQNQSDCTFTVLALLPDTSQKILEALPVEQLTHELQQMRADRRAPNAGGASPSSKPSSVGDGDAASVSSLSSSYVKTSQMTDSESSLPRPKKSKAQLWNEIKISSITRSFTLLYTLALLNFLTRIQLNLLGRLSYLSSVIALARPLTPERAFSISLEDNSGPGSPGGGPASGNEFETNRRYLAFTWYLLNRGYVKLLEEVRAAVVEVFGSISPTETMTVERLSDLTLQVRQKVEGADSSERRNKDWLTYLLPPREEEESVLSESGVLNSPVASPPSSPASNPLPPSGLSSPVSPLRNLLNETSDLIESPTFSNIQTQLLDSLFSRLIDHNVIPSTFPPPPPPSSHQPRSPIPSALQTQLPAPEPPTTQSQPLTEIPSTITVVPASASPPSPNPTLAPAPTAKLANILACLTRQAHVIGSASSPLDSEYLETMEREVRDLEAFAAVVYSSRWGGLEGIEEDGEDEVIEEVKKEDDAGVQSMFEGVWSRISGTAVR